MWTLSFIGSKYSTGHVQFEMVCHQRILKRIVNFFKRLCAHEGLYYKCYCILIEKSRTEHQFVLQGVQGALKSYEMHPVLSFLWSIVAIEMFRKHVPSVNCI